MDRAIQNVTYLFLYMVGQLSQASIARRQLSHQKAFKMRFHLKFDDRSYPNIYKIII